MSCWPIPAVVSTVLDVPTSSAPRTPAAKDASMSDTRKPDTAASRPLGGRGVTGCRPTADCKFFPMDPQPSDIATADIARALSMQCRYNGHTSAAYSWLRALGAHLHSRMPRARAGRPAPRRHRGLPRRHGQPLKRHISQYMEIEQRLWRSSQPPTPTELPECVKQADTRILIDERAALLGLSPAPWGTEHLEPCVIIRALPQPQAEALRGYLSG